MAQGDGSVIPKGKNVWRVQLSLGADPATGKYRKVSRTVRGSKSDARKALAELRRMKDVGIRLEASKTTLYELSELWIEAKRASGTCSEHGVRNYAKLLSYVSEVMGHIPAARIDARMVEQAYMRIRAEKGLSGTTMRMLHNTLKSVFEKGIDYEIMTRNPCRRVTAPKRSAVERRSLNEIEAAHLARSLDAEYTEQACGTDAKEERQIIWGVAAGRSQIKGVVSMAVAVAARIALATGMRRGEVRALRWGDVDLGRYAVHVTHSLTQQGELKAPKSKAGIRTIAIDPGTAERLASWKKRQADYLAKLGIIQGTTTPVCCNNAGGFIDDTRFSQEWNALRVRCGFPDLKFHELRHTQATQLLGQGADLKMVQTRLGHSSAALTLSTYVHAIPENDARAARMVGAMLDGDEGLQGGESAHEAA